MIAEIFSVVMILLGVFLLLSGSLGLLRLPDFYCRMHATGKCDTLGALLALAGLAVYNGFNLVSLKILFIVVFIFIANPTSTHAIARAAFLNRVRPWEKKPSGRESASPAQEKNR